MAFNSFYTSSRQHEITVESDILFENTAFATSAQLNSINANSPVDTERFVLETF